MTCQDHRISLSPKGRLIFHGHDKSLWLEDELRVLAGLGPACECAAELRRWRDPIERCQTPELQKAKATQTRMRIRADGDKAWWQNGELHRDDGPAQLAVSPPLFVSVGVNNRRDDGPAVIYADGNKEWYRNGVRVIL